MLTAPGGDAACVVYSRQRLLTVEPGSIGPACSSVYSAIVDWAWHASSRGSHRRELMYLFRVCVSVCLLTVLTQHPTDQHTLSLFVTVNYRSHSNVYTNIIIYPVSMAAVSMATPSAYHHCAADSLQLWTTMDIFRQYRHRLRRILHMLTYNICCFDCMLVQLTSWIIECTMLLPRNIYQLVYHNVIYHLS